MNYFNPYMNYNPYMNKEKQIADLKNMADSINNQIMQLQQQPIPQMPQQPTNLTQNFQLAPTNSGNLQSVNSIEDVQKEIVLADTYFISKDLSALWIKNPKGDIRTFIVNEIIPKDEKDILIENLQKEIKQLKGGNVNATREYSNSNDEQLYEQSSSKYDRTMGNETTTNESSRLSDIQDGKTTKRKS